MQKKQKHKNTPIKTRTKVGIAITNMRVVNILFLVPFDLKNHKIKIIFSLKWKI